MSWLPLKRCCMDAGKYGLNVSPVDYVDSGVRLLRTTDLNESGMQRDGGVYLNAPVPNGYDLLVGDILLSRSGTVGRAYCVGPDAVGATFAGFLVRLRPRPGVVAAYLSYCVQSQLFLEQVKSGAIASTIQNFNAERYANVLVYLPDDVEQQRRVVAFLDHQVAIVDSAIDGRRKQAELLQSGILAIAHEEVTGREASNRVPTALPWSPTLPATWRTARLSTVAAMGSGHTPSRAAAHLWEDCTIPWLTTGDVNRLRNDEVESLDETVEHISRLGLHNSAAVLHPPGTVALSRTASPGFSAVMSVPMATSQDFVVWRPTRLLHPYFLLWCLRAMRCDLLGRLAMGSTHKTIYFPDLEKIRVPVPPLDVQLAIANRIRSDVARVATLANQIRESIRLLEERKAALITAAVTGEFDVTTAGPRAAAAVIG